MRLMTDVKEGEEEGERESRSDPTWRRRWSDGKRGGRETEVREELPGLDERGRCNA